MSQEAVEKFLFQKHVAIKKVICFVNEFWISHLDY